MSTPTRNTYIDTIGSVCFFKPSTTQTNALV